MTSPNPVIEAFKEVMQPGSDLGAGRWMKKHVKVIDSPHGANYDIDQTPWFREILEAFEDNSNEEIVVIAPVGSGKTGFYEAAAQWIIVEAPGGTLIALQTNEDAKELWDSRLVKAIRLCQPIKPLLPKNRHLSRKTGIIFPHMNLYIGGANLSNLQSKSMRWVIGDEVWLWKPGMMDEARGRTHDRWNARILFVSQGGEEDTELHTAWKETNQCFFSWQCEKCGKWHKWVHSHIKFKRHTDSEGNYDWDKIEKSVYMECPNEKCKTKYTDDLETRRWLSNGSKYIAENPTAIKVKKGFTWSDYAVWWKPWFKLVERWIKADDEKKKGNFEPLKKVVQKRFAQFWKIDYGEAKTELIAADYNKSDYAEGERWDGELHRIMTVDVQRDHFWCSIRVWKADGSSRLIYESKIVGWDTIRDIQERYKVKDKLTFIDAQYETGRVYDYCAKWNWTALHGSGRDGFIHIKGKKKVKKFYSKVQFAQTPSGGRARYIHWVNEVVKDKLTVLRSGQGVDWEIPKDASDSYKQQIDSEVKRDVVVDKKTKRVKKMYVKIKTDNHLWDTEAMSVAVAMMLGIIAEPNMDKDSEDEES